MKNVLMVAYYFPPRGGVGVQRTAKFVKYLPQYGWSPSVLTISSTTSSLNDPTMEAEIPTSTRVYRTKATSLPGFLPWRMRSFIARWFLVDEQESWFSTAVNQGLEAIGNEKFDLLYSTSSPYTDHLVALELNRRTGIPWVADFRDPWLGNISSIFPTTLHRKRAARLERQIVKSACRVVAVTEYHQKSFVGWYSDLVSEKFIFLPNGFDPADFDGLNPAYKDPDRFVIVYTGSFYQQGRTPAAFLTALNNLVQNGQIPRDIVRVRFIGNMGNFLMELIKSLNMEDMVDLGGFLPHRESLAQLLAADLLLLISNTGPGSEGIYPGKLFEYLAACKPILALAPTGATAELIKEAQAGYTVDPQDVNAISSKLVELYHLWQRGELSCTPREEVIARFDRRKQANKLALLFDECLAAPKEHTS